MLHAMSTSKACALCVQARIGAMAAGLGIDFEALPQDDARGLPPLLFAQALGCCGCGSGRAHRGAVMVITAITVIAQ